MSSRTESSARVAFGLYEADLQSGELWKAGRRIKLQSQPFKVLAALVERPGEVVTREELQAMLWGKDAVGDFDHSLGTAINKIRDALSDTADNPRFVETLARRGYRFIAPVSVPPAHSASSPGVVESTPGQLSAVAGSPESPSLAFQDRLLNATIAPANPSSSPVRARRVSRPRVAMLLLAMSAVGLAALAGFWAGSSRSALLPRIERITRSGRIAPGTQALESLPASVTDGLRLFTPVISEGRTAMAQVDLHTGALQTLNVPNEIPSPGLGDLSPDGGSLLVRTHLSPESEQPLWTVPTAGGSALRLSNVVAHDATWMPDGRGVLYAAGNELRIHTLADDQSRLFATLPGRAFWLRWSPDGSLLRFTLTDPVSHTFSLWQLEKTGQGLREILNGWSQPASDCCGVWSGDGRVFIFQSTHGDNTDLWRLDGKGTSHPAQITNGPLSFEAPAMSRTGHRIFFLGLENHASLLQYDPASHAFVSAPDFLGVASRVEYSRDGQWVLWTDSAGHLWRAKPDGTERVQVTPNSLQVFLAHWSPNRSSIALMAREPGKAWQIYLVGPDGGTTTPLLSENRNSADPSWSGDGQRMVFGRVTDIMGKEDGPRALQILDLKTHTVTTIPASDGLFSPRWSPDGRFIAALSLDQRKLVLFDVATGRWRTISDDTAADPVWTADSRFIVFHASQADQQPIYRVSIADGKLEKIATLSSFSGAPVTDYFFCGLTPRDVPIVRARTGTGDVYSMNLDER